MTNEKLQIVEEAKQAGYDVKESSSGVIFIRRYSNHKMPRVLQGAVIYPDGIAVDILVVCSIAKAIRSAASLRKLLDLPGARIKTFEQVTR